jgi:hypothetical protein
MSVQHRNDRPYTLARVRTGQDPSERFRTYGPIRPMDEKPGLFRRLFDW